MGVTNDFPTGMTLQALPGDTKTSKTQITGKRLAGQVPQSFVSPVIGGWNSYGELFFSVQMRLEMFIIFIGFCYPVTQYGIHVSHICLQFG